MGTISGTKLPIHSLPRALIERSYSFSRETLAYALSQSHLNVLSAHGFPSLFLEFYAHTSTFPATSSSLVSIGASRSLFSVIVIWSIILRFIITYSVLQVSCWFTSTYKNLYVIFSIENNRRVMSYCMMITIIIWLISSAIPDS